MDYQQIFEAITQDPHYRRNLEWGEPRPGHPEGTIRAHIEELERNLQRLVERGKVSQDGPDYWKLKILIHAHDTFKPDAVEGVPISDPRSHASLARAFLARYCSDPDLLNMIQLHDEPFALWHRHRSKRATTGQRFQRLLETIRDRNLFALFLIIDGCTEGKGREPLRWFLGAIQGKVDTTVTPADIL